MTESTLSNEVIQHETAEQTEHHDEVEVKEEEPVKVNVSESATETSLPEELPTMSVEDAPMATVEEPTTEAAYDEFLKDTAEPVNQLDDHTDEIKSETPVTKVSKNGEVRIAMDTKNAHVWNELGNIYLNSGTYDDAIASYSKAIELDRNFAWPYSNLALAYVQKGRFAEAILLYQRGIELFTLDRDKAITWNRLGNVYRRINDYSNAIASYQTADELDPENATLSMRAIFGLLGNMYPESKPAYAS
jgi:tetratricopeptide (TPR) repeat protein